MAEHTTIAVGQFSITAINPIIDAGMAYSFDKLKLNETFVETTQIIDNSVMVVLIDGSTITLTNTVSAGVLKLSAIRHSNDYRRGDIVAYAEALLNLGAIVGSTFRISFPFNGAMIAYTLQNCNVKTVPRLIMAGNDVPTYSVEFHYGEITQI